MCKLQQLGSLALSWADAPQKKVILIFHLIPLNIVHSCRFSNIVRLTKFCTQINLVKIHVDAVLERRGEETGRATLITQATARKD